MKDFMETHPFEKLPKVEQDEDNRFDYQQVKEEAETLRADSFFAPSEGY